MRTLSPVLVHFYRAAFDAARGTADVAVRVTADVVRGTADVVLGTADAAVRGTAGVVRGTAGVVRGAADVVFHHHQAPRPVKPPSPAPARSAGKIPFRPGRPVPEPLRIGRISLRLLRAALGEHDADPDDDPKPAYHRPKHA